MYTAQVEKYRERMYVAMTLAEACALAQRLNSDRWPAYVVLRIERGPSLTTERYSLVLWRARDQQQVRIESLAEVAAL